MTDPPRWLTDAGTPDTVRALLGALEAPAPLSPEKQAALARQLAEISASAGAAGTGAVAGAWLKVKIGLVCGACLGGGLVVAHWVSEEAQPRPVVAAVQSSPLDLAPGRVPETSSTPAPVSPDGDGYGPSAAMDPAAAGETTAATAAAPSGATTKPARGVARDVDGLAREEALLERARSLAANDPRGALRLLRRHGRRFPQGQLAAERMFLSVQVLEQLGEEAAAREEAEVLMERFPRSSYAARLRGR